MATFHATFAESEQFSASFSEGGNFDAEFGEIQYIEVGDYYEGDYSATPSEETQILPTESKLMAHDFVINPVPDNYARMLWNGTILTFY